jgi:hypothetical protein
MTAMISALTPSAMTFRGHPRAGLVNRLLRQFDPPDPVVPTARDDLDVFRLVLRLSVEAASILSKPGPSRRRRLFPTYCPVLIDEVDVELDQQALHLGLVLL